MRILVVLLISVLLWSCGPSAEEKAAMEKAEFDSAQAAKTTVLEKEPYTNVYTSRIYTVNHEGHEYIILLGSMGAGIIHSPECKK